MSPKINHCACTFYEKGGGGGGVAREGGRKVESANVASQTKANRGKSVTVTMHEIHEFQLLRLRGMKSILENFAMIRPLSVYSVNISDNFIQSKRK